MHWIPAGSSINDRLITAQCLSVCMVELFSFLLLEHCIDQEYVLCKHAPTVHPQARGAIRTLRTRPIMLL